MDQKESSSEPLDELTSNLNNGKLLIFETLKKIEQRLEILKQKEEAWLSLEKKVEDKKESLLRIPNTYFHALLGSGKWQPDSEGTYFVDRSPKFFDRILEFMRSGKMDFYGLDDHSLEKLQEDCDYYQIAIPLSRDQMFTCVSFDLSTKSSLAIINGNSLATTATSGWGTVFGKLKENGKSFYFEVVVNSQGGARHVRLGIANSKFNKEVYVANDINSLLYSGNDVEGFAKPALLFTDSWNGNPIIGIMLNIKESFVRFYCNKKLVAQVPLPDPKSDWKPAFSVHCAADKITLLGDVKVVPV